MRAGSGKSRLMTAPLLTVRFTGEASTGATPRIEIMRDVKIMDKIVNIRKRTRLGGYYFILVLTKSICQLTPQFGAHPCGRVTKILLSTSLLVCYRNSFVSDIAADRGEAQRNSCWQEEGCLSCAGGHGMTWTGD